MGYVTSGEVTGRLGKQLLSAKEVFPGNLGGPPPQRAALSGN
jgi:hypothetical protein